MRPARERADPGARPSWAVPEIAWFAALIGGFVATWAGAESRVPAAGALLAGAFATAYQALLLRRGSDGGAAMVASAATLGVIVGAVALTGEVGPDAVRRAFPLSGRYVEREILPLVAGTGAPSLAPAVIAAVGIALGLLTARATAGLVPLLLAAAFAGALGLSAPIAAGGGAVGSVGVLQSLHSIPPWALLQLGGLVLAQSVLAGPDPILPLDEMRPVRRRLLASGAAAACLGLALRPVLAAAWGAWVPSPS